MMDWDMRDIGLRQSIPPKCTFDDLAEQLIMKAKNRTPKPFTISVPDQPVKSLIELVINQGNAAILFVAVD